MTRRRRRLRPIRPPATCLSDDEVLAAILDVLYRTGQLRLDDMVAAVLEAERQVVRSRLHVVPSPWAAMRSCCPSGAA